MQITVFGASGGVGSLVVEEALQRGYTVVAMVHNHNLASPNPNLIVRQGDIHNPGDVAAVLEGSSAVISCLGSWGVPARNVLSSFTAHAIPAMHSHHITRIVTLTGIGVQAHPWPLQGIIMRLLGWTPPGKIFEDAARHLQLLVKSDLSWTTLCSPVMNDSGRIGYHLSNHIGNPFATINRRAVASALIDQLACMDYVGKALVIHRR